MRTAPLRYGFVFVSFALLAGCVPPETGGGPRGGAGGAEPTAGTGGGSPGFGGSGGSPGFGGTTGTGGTGGTGGSGGYGGSGGTTAQDAGPRADGGGGSGGTGGAIGGSGGSGGAAGGGGSGGAPPGSATFPGCPNCVPIFDGKTLTGWQATKEKYDVIMDDRLKKPVMRSTGASRGFLATDKSYQNFRLIYSNRLLGGGHAQNMLLWCQRNDAGTYPNDACGGIQYQPPGKSMWDYRPGQNKSPAGKTSLGNSGASGMDWSQCEMLVKGTTAEFRVACCKLTPGAGPCKGIEILRFKDTVSMGNLKGPIAWQAHNGGHVIHWTDVFVEENPAVDDLITTK